MARYYDVVLGLIPLALLGISAVLVAGGFQLTTAVPVGATVSVGLIGHAMFVRGPVDGTVEDADREPATPLESAD